MSIGGQICQGLGLVAGIGRIDIGAGRKDKAQAFVVEEEEGLVCENWSADGRCPLVDVVEILRCAGLVKEEVVGIQGTSVPPVRALPWNLFDPERVISLICAPPSPPKEAL